MKDEPCVEGDRTLCIDSKAEPLRAQRVIWNHPNLFSTVSTIFRSHWSLLTWMDTDFGRISTLQSSVDGVLLTAWILTVGVQSNIDRAETRMRSLAYSTVEDDQERFTQLACLRRDLGSCYDELKRSRSFVLHGWKYQKNVFARGGFLRKRFPGHEPGVTKPLLDHQAELEKRLDAVKEDLNEEIQVTVGTVQVRDAQLMKEQARVTARQTAWTVALTVLAAVYLPMTLVTGIFGMNITEISSEVTAPNAWWAVGAWAVVVILTVTGISPYVIVRKLRARKKQDDLEAMQRYELGIQRTRPGGSTGLGGGARRWSLKLRQKVKTFRGHREDDSESMEEYELELREAGPDKGKWQMEGAMEWGRSAKQNVKAIWSRKRE
jgi:hypothetical protein